jgi:FtsH-binding integral membrane protein
MVNSALYNQLFGGNKNMRHTNGFHHFNLNLNLVGGRKKRGGANSSSSFFNLLNEKKQFLITVFANLITQLGITYYVMMNFNSKIMDKNRMMFWGLFIVQLVLITILALVPMPSFMKFILFSLFSACSGVMLSFMKKEVDPNIIQTAILGAISVFGLMFLFGAALLMFGIKLGFQFASFLFFALLFLIIVQIVFLFSGKSSVAVKGFSIVGLIIFSLYVIYDTNNILQREYYGDFITASLDYYLDILNIFVDLVSLNNN